MRKRKPINWDNPPAELGYREFMVPSNWVPILKRNSMEGEFKLVEEMDDLCKVKITTGTYIIVTNGGLLRNLTPAEKRWLDESLSAMR